MKKILKAISDEFIYGGHLLALGPALIAYCGMLALKLGIRFDLLILVYLINYMIYALDRYYGQETDEDIDRKAHLAKYSKYFLYIFSFCIILTFALAYNLGPKTLALTTILILIGLSYGLFFKKITRYIIGFKSLLVACLFPAVLLFLPINYTKINIFPIIWLYLFFFMRLFVNTIFCDYKDKDEDRKDNLKTFAVVLRSKDFKIFLHTINLLSVLFILIPVFKTILPTWSLLFIVVFPYGYYYLKNGLANTSIANKFANNYADGEFLLWLLIILIGKSLWA